ncbi:hypothetical protein T492DRAFT_858305 [Pavlovales sp. CCMP2436]|nr:hypothetical protein T492DRAFT_858305 [Pavlovales sp. CCMP2436]
MCALRGHAKVIISRARLERTGTGTGNGGGTRTDSDDDGNPDEWAEAYRLEALRKDQAVSPEANFADMGAETWMGKLSAPTTMQACNTLLELMRKELGVIVARGHARLILARARSLHT